MRAGAIRNLCVAALLAVGAKSVHADDPPSPPPAYDAAPCEQCHSALKARKVVHRIFLAGTCASCHLPASAPGKCKSPTSSGWKLAAEGPKLCQKCHDIQPGATPLHPAIDKHGCIGCHDPHSSDNPNHLKAWPADTLCYGCHKRKDDHKEVHGAVKNGLCLGCHNPHVGKEAPLLKKTRDKLCLQSCHKPQDLLKQANKHPPVAENRCLGCHDPHSSDFPKHTLAAGKALCLRCHDSKAEPHTLGAMPMDSKRIDLTKKVVHKALVLDECQKCHESHSSANKKLLKMPAPDVCYQCHDRKDAKSYVHGAVRNGDCPVCHNPHSSDETYLLRAKAGKPLCFQCHQDDLTGRKFVHKPTQEGKECLNCHDAHASKFPFNIKKGQGKEVCYKCHKEKDTGKNKHLALERYGCTACHDPHGSGNQYQLAKPVNKLCQSCHKDKTDGMHVTTFVASGHKIAGGPDPHEIDKNFSCASCHNPHGSDSPKLLRFGETTMEVCDWCHGDRTGKHPELKDITKRKRPEKPVDKPPVAQNQEVKK